MLRGDPQCPLPFGVRARTLYSEVVLQSPPPDDPYFAMDEEDRSPLARRIIAAKAAGLVITAETVRTAAQAACSPSPGSIAAAALLKLACANRRSAASARR
ncbi:MAG: hypothetical protein R3C16_01485 [Hyphomonadaceae bacterium]